MDAPPRYGERCNNQCLCTITSGGTAHAHMPPKKGCKTMVQKVWYRTTIFLGFMHHEDRLQDWLRARLHRYPGNPPATRRAPTRQVQPHLSGESVRGHSRTARAAAATR